jgi:hypothetical protein
VTRRTILLVGGGAFLIVAAIVVVVVVLLLLRGMSRPGEVTARYLPANTQVYISVNLRPGSEQMGLARKVIDRLQTDDFLDRRDDLLDEAEDETGIHFLDDVTSWIGSDVSLALLDAGPDRLEWILLAQVNDRESAVDFIEDLADFLEGELNTEFVADRRSGVDLWVAGEDLAVALTGEYMLMADSEDTIDEMLDNLESPPSRPLGDSPEFLAARESLPAERVMFMFVQAEDVLETLVDAVGLYEEEEEEVLRQAQRNTPEYVAASASFVDNGIRFELVGETPSRAFTLDGVNGLNSPEALPIDTLVLFSAVGVDQAWEELRDSIENLDPDSQNDFEGFLEDVEDELGVDLERDVIDALTGEVAFALLPSDLGGLLGGGPASGVVEGLLLAGVRDARSIMNALDTFADALEDEGFDIDRDSLGEYEVVTTRADDFPGGAYQPGYIVTEEWAVVGSNVDGLEAFYEAVSGETDTLGSKAEFRELIEAVPEPLHYLVYADIAGVLEMVEDALDADTAKEYRREVKPLVDQLSAFMLAVSVTDADIRLSATLTLRE